MEDYYEGDDKERPTEMELAEKLARALLVWWHSTSRTAPAPDWLARDITFNSGLQLLRGEEVTLNRSSTHPWENIRILVAFGNSAQAAIVYEGFDPVIASHRREAWVVTIVNEQIAHILAVDMISYAAEYPIDYSGVLPA